VKIFGGQLPDCPPTGCGPGGGVATALRTFDDPLRNSSNGAFATLLRRLMLLLLPNQRYTVAYVANHHPTVANCFDEKKGVFEIFQR